jgi:3-dehydroquinate dehydratase / shikimate dehydrogenase
MITSSCYSNQHVHRMPALPRSLPRICVALGLPTASQLARAAESEYKNGSAFLEFRLDYLPDPAAGIEVIRKIRKSYPDAYVLATCRHKQASGHYGGEIAQQLAILESAALAGAAFVDLEIESAEQAKTALPGLRAVTPLCISYHNFQSTPAFPVIVRRLRRVPADAYKIAITARKYSDNLRLIEFARAKRSEPLIALAMSETGLVTRVLMPSMGCAYTYAAPNGEEGTAPGQIPAAVMRTLYRCEKLTKQSRVYGVIANPVAHSKSPLIHNRAFQSRRVDAVYLPFLVAPGQLADWMKFATALPVSGFSVTIPHKQHILRYLDVVDSQARRIGAVNTVWRKGGKWRGTNTDTEGVLKPLGRQLRLAHASVLIAGYGGAARAAAIALSDASANVTITGRDIKAAQTLARAVKGEAVSLQEASASHYDALVHATPLGMHPAVDGCLFDGVIPADVVLDMVYNPRETVLLRRAKEQGRTVIPGIEMLLEQAAHQFEIWTGETAPRLVMRNALEGQG